MTDRVRGSEVRSRRHFGLIAVCLAVALTSAVAWRVDADNALPNPGWDVTAAPTVNLLDGNTVTVNVRSNSDVAITNLEIRECRLGPSYVDQADNSSRTGNCPLNAVSSSADSVIVRSASDGLITLARSAAGANVNFRIGTGTTTWDAANGPASLTCDLANPCALVVQVRVGADYTYKVFRLDFTDADPLKACGGTASGVLSAAASDEIADGWAQWTRSYCQQSPGGAPSTTAFTGEGAALTTYLNGGNDLAYGSSGLDPATGIVAPDTPSRSTVAIPVAVNAAVVGVGGGHRTLVGGIPIGDKVAYPQLEMRVSDSAALLGGGIGFFKDDQLQYQTSVLSRNPALGGIPYWNLANVLASSLPLTSTWLTTSYFTAAAPADWVSRRTSPPTPRGASASLAGAIPDFPDTSLLTGRPAFQKTTVPASLNDPDGPLWVFTDRATAASLGLTPAALETADGSAFVAPTSESMSAAVAQMKPDARGVLQPVLTSGSGASAQANTATPYPLTYVMYAFVPAEPLVDSATCVARTESQTLLKNWLEYVTGAGQQYMAPGLEALPASLQSEAQSAIAKVGTAAVTGACAGKVVTPTSTGAESGSVGSAPSSGLPVGSLASTGGVNAPTSATPLTPGSEAAPGKEGTTAIAIPAFAGHRIADPIGGIVALIGIVLVMSLGAWITAGGQLSGGGQWSPGSLGALTPGRIGSLVLLWGGVGIAGIGLVLFQLGPLLEQRDQRSLLSQYKVDIRHAAGESQSLAGVSAITKPPEQGDPVGILEIGALKNQDVVVEGVSASQTRQGPGHVPGTSGLGQSGNSVVVARRNGYGGAFGGIGLLRKGDRIVVTTTQGQSVYAVKSVKDATITGSADDSSSTSTTAAVTTTSVAPSSTTTSPTTSTVPASSSTPSGAGNAQSAAYTKDEGSSRVVKVSVDTLYGPTSNDRLTLVTSASKAPWNSSEATVVTATLVSKPFAPTPQGGRSSDQTGMHGDPGAWSAIALILMGFAGVIVASVALYRKTRFRVAYVLTIAPLVAFTVLTGETLARLLPAWT